jgi:hypothetical protein
MAETQFAFEKLVEYGLGIFDKLYMLREEEVLVGNTIDLKLRQIFSISPWLLGVV